MEDRQGGTAGLLPEERAIRACKGSVWPCANGTRDAISAVERLTICLLCMQMQCKCSQSKTVLIVCIYSTIVCEYCGMHCVSYCVNM